MSRLRAPAPDIPADRHTTPQRSVRELTALLLETPVPVLLLDPSLCVVDFNTPLRAFLRSLTPGAALSSLDWRLDMGWLPATARRIRAGSSREERVIATGAARHCVRLLPWHTGDGTGVAVALLPLDRPVGDAGDDRSRIVEAQRIIHQMSNSVLLMRSVMRRSAETAENVEEYVMRLESRTDTIVRVLVALVRDPARTFGLRELIEDELEAQGAFHHGGARLFGGPPLHLRPAAAQVLALVFQELVTNSFQHGALGGECGGQLHVSWEIVEDGRLLQLDWAEQGRHAPWAGRGFGTMVLESVLSYQLDGRVERSFSARGLRIRLTIPVAILTADQESCC